MAKTFDVSEMIWVEIEGGQYHICPDCENHEQGKPTECHDCKNVFVKDGQSVGQCMCYSPAHGKRED